jgi:hypothetical protein
MNQEDGWRQEVVALEDEACRAFVARDIERLNTLWSDQLLVSSPINKVLDKRRVLDLLQAGTIAHYSLKGSIDTIERRQDLVVVMGSELVMNSPGGHVIKRRYTNVWRAEGPSWRLLVRHANIILNDDA